MDNKTIKSLLSERAAQENSISKIEVTASTITVHLVPKIAMHYERSDAKEPVSAEYHDSESVLIQGLGIQGKALRYRVVRIRLGYVNDAGELKTFTVPIAGIRTELLVTDEVVDKMLYFNVERNMSLGDTVQMLQDVYGVQTSTSALDRWKNREAEAWPSIGQMIKMLNEKKKITALHLDEYQATGTKNWELAIRDEHGRLLFSMRLKKRDAWPIKVILRWLRIVGLEIEVFYVDFWLAYPPAIKAIYPEADIPYDFFHVMQNIHRHLYKALTAYRKAFKNAKCDKEQAKIRKQLHKKLWKYRYLLFTNDENLTDPQRQILAELLQEHPDTLVEYMVLFRQQVRLIFNASDTFAQAVDYLSALILDGWDDRSPRFTKITTFLQDHIENILTYLRKPGIQRNSLSECTVRSLRRIEKIRQGFKTHSGRVNHLKLLLWRSYLS